MAAAPAGLQESARLTLALANDETDENLDTAKPEAVLTRVLYGEPPPEGQGLFTLMRQPQAGEQRSNLELDPHWVQVQDLRSSPTAFGLNTTGFQLERLAVPERITWSDRDEVSLLQCTATRQAAAEASFKPP